MSLAAAPLRLHRERVLPDWVDYNGHMSEAYYVLVFGHSTDAFLDHIGLGEAERRRTATSLYTLESHTHFLREVPGEAALETTTQLVGHDTKRARIYHEMFIAGQEAPVAATELMLLHVDMTGPRAAPFPPALLARLEAVAAAQTGLPPPRHGSRPLLLPGRG